MMKHFKKLLQIFLIFAIIAGWLFSGFPRIWQEPPIPPEVKRAKAAPWTLVGQTTAEIANGVTDDVTLPGSPQTNDIVIAVLGTDYNTGEAVINTTGYTELYDSGDANPVSLLKYKIMGATPDSVINVTKTSNATARAMAVIIQVWRGVDTTTPIDATPTTAGGTSGMPDSPSYTPVTDGALVFSVGFLDDDNCTTVTAPTDFSNLTYGSADADGQGITLMMASYEQATAAAINPAIFTGTGSVSDAWDAVTFALRPIANQVTIAASGDSTQPTGVSANDGDVLMGAFTFVSDTSTATVTSITINEEGTLVADTQLTDLRIYYKTEATCQTSIPGDATLFNSTGGTFDSNDESTVTGSMSVGTSQVCVYVRVDVGSGVSAGQTIEIQIDEAGDVLITDGSPTAASWPVQLSGTTTVKAQVGSIISTEVGFGWVSGESSWGQVIWNATEPTGSNVRIYVYYDPDKTSEDHTDCDTVVPNAALTDNETGFESSPIDISGLSVVTYERLCLKASLSAGDSDTPTLNDWAITWEPPNTSPTIGEVSLNSKQTITLIENTQIDILASASITDTDGCDDISGVKAIVYHYSSYTASCSDDANNCYDEDNFTCVADGACVGNTQEYNCYASSSMQFFADPTDAGSSFSSDEWVVSVIASDSVWQDVSSNSYDDNDETDIEVATLTALEITAGDPINYGEVIAGQDTGASNETTTVKNTGNRGIDVLLSGTNLTGACGTITVDNQQYASASFTYDDYGTALTDSNVRYEGGSISWAKPTSATPVTNDIYWGIGVPAGTGAGVCNGTDYFSASAEQ